MVDKIFEVVREVYAQGVTMLLVEQNASRALGIGQPRLRDGVGPHQHERRRQADAQRPEGARRLPGRVNGAGRLQ